MLLQSLRALCLAPGGSGSVWKYSEAMVRSPGVSGRIAYAFWTELHFADFLMYASLRHSSQALLCHADIKQALKEAMNPDSKQDIKQASE